MKIPALRIYTICYLIFLYTPIVILPIFAFNNSTAVAFPLQGFTTEWFYNIKTGDVEEGRVSIASELDGPFATREDAANAPAILAERSRKWAAEDANGH